MDPPLLVERRPAGVAGPGERDPRGMHLLGQREGRFGRAEQPVRPTQCREAEPVEHEREFHRVRGAEQAVDGGGAPGELVDVGPAVRLGAARRQRPLRRPPAERVDSLTRDLLRSVGHTPALVLGRRTDVLAWNASAHALLAGHLDPTAPDRPEERPNLSRMLFLDPHTRDLYVDWERKARAVVGSLRQVAGRHPEDALLASLVGELSMASAEFAALWGDHRVRPCKADAYRLRHPLCGELTVTQQILVPARSPEQSLVLVTTGAEDSGAQDALALLATGSGRQSAGSGDGGESGDMSPSTRAVPRSRSVS